MVTTTGVTIAMVASAPPTATTATPVQDNFTTDVPSNWKKDIVAKDDCDGMTTPVSYQPKEVCSSVKRKHETETPSTNSSFEHSVFDSVDANCLLAIFNEESGGFKEAEKIEDSDESEISEDSIGSENSEDSIESEEIEEITEDEESITSEDDTDDETVTKIQRFLY